MLEAYFSDWDAIVDYSCTEYMHPLEITYLKSKVRIFPKDVEKDAYLKDKGYRHDGHRATMEESMEEAAFTTFCSSMSIVSVTCGGIYTVTYPA